VQQVANHSLANATAFSTPSSEDRSAIELDVREERALTNPSVSLSTISGSSNHTLLSIVFPTPIDKNGFIGS
jgi:hypothetical protein